MENFDRSVSVSIMNEINPNIDYQTVFFTISNVNLNESLNSPIVYVNLLPKTIPIDRVQITFRHLNESTQTPVCVQLKHIQK